MKKNIYILASAMLIIAAFFIGRNTSQELPVIEIIPENYVKVSKVVDWNTDGKELAIFTKDGYELYCYKSENIYTK